MQIRIIVLVGVAFLATSISCRSIVPVRQIHTSSSPDISRVTLKSGKIVTFDDDFGWYNKQAGTVEGMTADSQHVEYHLSEILRVETVRAYSLIPAIAVGLVPLAIAIYLLYKLFSIL